MILFRLNIFTNANTGADRPGADDSVDSDHGNIFINSVTLAVTDVNNAIGNDLTNFRSSIRISC